MWGSAVIKQIENLRDRSYCSETNFPRFANGDLSPPSLHLIPIGGTHAHARVLPLPPQPNRYHPLFLCGTDDPSSGREPSSGPPLPILELLLSRRADPQLRSSALGLTALQTALLAGQTTIARALQARLGVWLSDAEYVGLMGVCSSTSSTSSPSASTAAPAALFPAPIGQKQQHSILIQEREEDEHGEPLDERDELPEGRLLQPSRAELARTLLLVLTPQVCRYARLVAQEFGSAGIPEMIPEELRGLGDA